MLGSQTGVKVVMGCRDSHSGKEAAQDLKDINCDVVFHQLDLTDHNSILKTYEFMAKEFGKLDVLVNNGALCFNDPTLCKLHLYPVSCLFLFLFKLWKNYDRLINEIFYLIRNKRREVCLHQFSKASCTNSCYQFLWNS
jgi:NAD(P)-dependent dehydrogenase (short-subunit alcohol dehydrogenase family)